MSTETELEAAALALIAVNECRGDGRRALAELRDGLAELDADERPIAARAIELIEERLR